MPHLRRLDGRVLEWALSVPLVMFGISILVWPAVANGSILHIVVDGIGAHATALLLLSLGLVGIVALVANGNSLKVGPHIRSISAALRAVLWASFVMSTLGVSVDQGFSSPVVYFFASFTVADLYITYRAVLDVRHQLVDN